MLQACIRMEPFSNLGRVIGDVSIGHAWTILPESTIASCLFTIPDRLSVSSKVQTLSSHTGTSTSQPCRARHVIDRAATISSDLRFAVPQYYKPCIIYFHNAHSISWFHFKLNTLHNSLPAFALDLTTTTTTTTTNNNNNR